MIRRENTGSSMGKSQDEQYRRSSKVKTELVKAHKVRKRIEEFHEEREFTRRYEL